MTNLHYLHNKILLKLVLSWALIGWVATLLGMFGLLHPITSLLLCIPFFLLFLSIRQFIINDLRVLFQTKVGIFLAFLLLLTLGSHCIGVMLPETGFDALWYHLPLIRLYSTTHTIIYTSEWYQSLYPQLGDVLFLLGFQLFGVLGAKIIAYSFMLTLLAIVYCWLREHLSVVWSVSGVLTVALFQVVGWQASSVYVDVVSALWFVAGCWVLSETDVRRDALRCVSTSLFFFACFVATKYVNLGFIPLIGLLLLVETQILAGVYPAISEARMTVFLRNGLLLLQKHILKISVIIFLASFWYIRAWWYTGNLLYPMGTEYANPVIYQMGKGCWLSWFLFQLHHIYRLPFSFFFQNDGYVTPLLWILPLLSGFFGIAKTNQMFSPKRREIFVVHMIGVYGLLFWWFFPPPSTRYVLGLIIVWWIGLCIAYVQWLEKQKKPWLISFSLVLMISMLIPFLAIRLYVNLRGIPYLLGKESQQQYLQRFKNGFLDEKIEGFY